MVPAVSSLSAAPGAQRRRRLHGAQLCSRKLPLFLLPFDSPRSVRERGWRAAGRPHGARSRPPGASSCPPHPAARFRHCKHPCFPPPSPSRSPPSRRSQRSALHASVGPAAAAQDPGSAKRRAQMAAGPRSSVVRYPLVSCSHCWMTCRLHLTMSLTSRQDFARYKHPVWKRMHGISGKQLCGCRDTAQRARSRCQFLAARPHGVLHWHHHISTVCVDDQLICPPLQNFEKMFMNRVLLYSAFSFSVR